MSSTVDLVERRQALVVLVALCVASTAAAQTDEGSKSATEEASKADEGSKPDGSSGSALGAVAASQSTGERGRLDAALQQIKDEDYAGASVVLYELANDPAAAAFKDDAEYHLAKSLYRLGLHHSSLVFFGSILSRGSSGRFYKSALEWCLFIARKIDADDEVLEVVAKYTDGTFSEAYKNEFRYELARYHYSQGLAYEIAERRKAAEEETSVEEDSEGGVSVRGNLFGEEEADEPKPTEATPEQKKSFDIFDDGSTKKEPPKVEAAQDPEPEKSTEKKKKKKKGKKKKKKSKKNGGGLSFDDPFASSPKEPEKPAPPPAPKPAPVAAPVAEAPKPPPAPKTEQEEAKKHIDLANRFVRMVEPSSPFAARAKFLEGVLLFKAGRESDAVTAFRTVIALTKGSDSEEDAQLRQLAFFQLARTHFGAQQPDKSIFYYDRIQRLTYEWLEALYEASWAQFRLGRYEKSLGNLLTLHSPFFKDEYFPESFILKAVSYYENCRYAETNEILKLFLADYEPVLKTLTDLTETAEGGNYYDTLNKLRGDADEAGGGQAEIVSRIVSLSMSDAELKTLDAAFREVDTELSSFDSQASGFGTSGLRNHLDQIVGESRGELARSAGAAVKRRLEEERDAIKELIDEAVRIQIETSASEQARIEAKLREVDQRPADKTNEYLGWTDDERLVWPFQNEYWRDELGTYELTLAQTCQ